MRDSNIVECNKKLEVFFSGKKLYGNDFNKSELEEWYRDEKEGYANLGAKNRAFYQYIYHSLNIIHGFRYLPSKTYQQALGLGSAYGDEFEPIADRIRHLTIIEPSNVFSQDVVHGIPTVYLKSESSGTLPVANNFADLILCFGVLHHLANVSYIINELFRCLVYGGFALIREPIVSMGDWTRPRLGLTKRERGIPIQIFRKFIIEGGFKIEKETMCVFPLIPRIWDFLGKQAYNNDIATRADALFSRILKFNLRYHRANLIYKFGPTNVFYVLSKK